MFVDSAESNQPKFNLLWMHGHVDENSLKNMTHYQRVNHFPGAYEMTRKDHLARNFNRMARHGFFVFFSAFFSKIIYKIIYEIIYKVMYKIIYKII